MDNKEVFKSLSIRAQNCLHYAGIKTITQLAMNRTQLWKLKNCGKHTIKELEIFLENINPPQYSLIREIGDVKLFGYNLFELKQIIDFAKSKKFEPNSDDVKL